MFEELEQATDRNRAVSNMDSRLKIICTPKVLSVISLFLQERTAIASWQRFDAQRKSQ